MNPRSAEGDQTSPRSVPSIAASRAGDADVPCRVQRVAQWESTLFSFGLGGLSPEEARETAAILFETQRVTERATQLWLVDFVGLGVEHGSAHEWDGTHAPAWPVPD